MHVTAKQWKVEYKNKNKPGIKAHRGYRVQCGSCVVQVDVDVDVELCWDIRFVDVGHLDDIAVKGAPIQACESLGGIGDFSELHKDLLGIITGAWDKQLPTDMQTRKKTERGREGWRDGETERETEGEDINKTHHKKKHL